MRPDSTARHLRPPASKASGSRRAAQHDERVPRLPYMRTVHDPSSLSLVLRTTKEPMRRTRRPTLPLSAKASAVPWSSIATHGAERGLARATRRCRSRMLQRELHERSPAAHCPSLATSRARRPRRVMVRWVGSRSHNRKSRRSGCNCTMQCLAAQRHRFAVQRGIEHRRAQ